LFSINKENAVIVVFLLIKKMLLIGHDKIVVVFY